MWPDRLTFTGATDNSLLVALCTISTHPLWVWPDGHMFTGSVVGRVVSPVCNSTHPLWVWPDGHMFTGPVVGRVELLDLCAVAVGVA